MVVILDDRTSNICRALAKEDKLYPLDVAIEVRDNLLDLDSKNQSLESARDYIKALAPWVSDSQIVRDNNGNPTGVSGAHTPFPPFHRSARQRQLYYINVMRHHKLQKGKRFFCLHNLQIFKPIDLYSTLKR